MIPHKAYVQEDYVLKKLRPKKKGTVVCLAGARSLLRPEKKDTICISSILIKTNTDLLVQLQHIRYI